MHGVDFGQVTFERLPLLELNATHRGHAARRRRHGGVVDGLARRLVPKSFAQLSQLSVLFLFLGGGWVGVILALTHLNLGPEPVALLFQRIHLRFLGCHGDRKL